MSPSLSDDKTLVNSTSTPIRKVDSRATRAEQRELNRTKASLPSSPARTKASLPRSPARTKASPPRSPARTKSSQLSSPSRTKATSRLPTSSNNKQTTKSAIVSLKRLNRSGEMTAIPSEPAKSVISTPSRTTRSTKTVQSPSRSNASAQKTVNRPGQGSQSAKRTVTSDESPTAKAFRPHTVKVMHTP